jgi:hypothetical protein
MSGSAQRVSTPAFRPQVDNIPVAAAGGASQQGPPNRVTSANPNLQVVAPQFIVPQPQPPRMRNLTNQLPPLSGPSTRNVELFANAGNYGSTRASNRVGGLHDRYAPNSQSRFTPYDVRT